jgi:hypothetical protein
MAVLGLVHGPIVAANRDTAISLDVRRSFAVSVGEDSSSFEVRRDL